VFTSGSVGQKRQELSIGAFLEVWLPPNTRILYWLKEKTRNASDVAGN
jgi:hypothetical protein